MFVYVGKEGENELRSKCCRQNTGFSKFLIRSMCPRCPKPSQYIRPCEHSEGPSHSKRQKPCSAQFLSLATCQQRVDRQKRELQRDSSFTCFASPLFLWPCKKHLPVDSRRWPIVKSCDVFSCEFVFDVAPLAYPRWNSLVYISNCNVI